MRKRDFSDFYFLNFFSDFSLLVSEELRFFLRHCEAVLSRGNPVRSESLRGSAKCTMSYDVPALLANGGNPSSLCRPRGLVHSDGLGSPGTIRISGSPCLFIRMKITRMTREVDPRIFSSERKLSRIIKKKNEVKNYRG